MEMSIARAMLSFDFTYNAISWLLLYLLTLSIN